MSWTELQFTIAPEVQNLGVRAVGLALGGLQNKKSDPEFEKYRDTELAKIRAGLTRQGMDSDPVLAGFRDLHRAAGCGGRKNIGASENLLGFLLKTGRLPSVNLLVDIYNLVSAQTGLALGAHDVARVAGNITLRLTRGDELFWPLGYTERKIVGRGEYAYIDDSAEILCRLDTRQCEKTKILETTAESFYIIQGNKNTPPEYVRAGAEKLIELTKHFCGGEVRWL